MEKTLYRLYKKRKKNNEIITPKMLKIKAKSLSIHKDFIASIGWYRNFKKRYNIQCIFNNKKNILNSKNKPENKSP